MKKLISRMLLCLLLFVLFWSLIFSSFLKVNAATDTIDLVAYHRGCIADAEARMVQIVNNIKSAYSRGQGNVINYIIFSCIYVTDIIFLLAILILQLMVISYL